MIEFNDIKPVFSDVFLKHMGGIGYVPIKRAGHILVRPVTEEIIHILTIKPEYCTRKDHIAFGIYCGVATVYRQSLDLNSKSHSIFDWMNSLTDIYEKSERYSQSMDDMEVMKQFNRINCTSDNLEQMVEYAYQVTKQLVLPVLENVTDLRSVLKYLMNYSWFSFPNDLHFSRTYYDEGIISLDNLFQEDHAEEHRRRMNFELELSRFGRIFESENKIKELYDNGEYSFPAEVTKFANDPDFMNRVHQEMALRKARNTELLRKIGVLK